MPAHKIYPYDGNLQQTSQNKPSEQILGLPNLGNTCFLNSAVQLLFASRSFRHYLLEQNASLQSMKWTFSLKQLLMAVLGNDERKKQRMMRLLIRMIESDSDDSQQNSYTLMQQDDSFIYLARLINHVTRQNPYSSALFIFNYNKICSNHFGHSLQSQMIQQVGTQLYLPTIKQYCGNCQMMGKQDELVPVYYFMTKPAMSLVVGGCVGKERIYFVVVDESKMGLRPKLLSYGNSGQKNHGKRKQQAQMVKGRLMRIVEYRLKGYISYMGNGKSGHYIATRRKLTNINIKTSPIQHQQSQQYYTFNDSSIYLADSTQIKRRKLCLYQKSHQTSIQQFIQHKFPQNTKQSQKSQKSQYQTILETINLLSKVYVNIEKDRNVWSQQMNTEKDRDVVLKREGQDVMRCFGGENLGDSQKWKGGLLCCEDDKGGLCCGMDNGGKIQKEHEVRRQIKEDEARKQIKENQLKKQQICTKTSNSATTPQRKTPNQIEKKPYSHEQRSPPETGKQLKQSFLQYPQQSPQSPQQCLNQPQKNSPGSTAASNRSQESKREGQSWIKSLFRMLTCRCCQLSQIDEDGPARTRDRSKEKKKTKVRRRLTFEQNQKYSKKR